MNTDSYNTVCVEHNTLCHASCSITFTGMNGTDFFNSCACMGPEKKCKVCGCISAAHAHMHRKPVINLQTAEEILHGVMKVTATDSKLILQEL